MDSGSSSRRFRPADLVAALLLAAVLLRGLIPAGFMPDFNALSGGVFAMVICTDGSEKTLFFDAEGNPVGEPDGPRADAPCLFAGLAAPLLPLLLPVLLLLLVWTPAPAPVQRRSPAFLPAGPPGPLTARGPPRLARS